ncbi:hypothetical protein E4N62_41775 [Streptomyces sp. MNU76]|uniref:hypothetical protein n=1 Tax=Streptomyces sp. MNU76 TaxID=2560026 RepID=UPI001E60D33E|nr:hypothetical protein [Streptomyces sp. MNU76]MCC9711188.1 hypothetical protein [Streptomyces sp. MNU76]
MTERPEGAPAQPQPQPQDQPSASPSAPPPQTPTQAEIPAQPAQAQAPTQAAVPSAYPYPDPQSPAASPSPRPYGPQVAPVAAQANPYGYPPGGYPPGGYPPGGYPPGGYPPLGAPPATGAGGRAVLWALVGAAVASAAWAGGVFLLGKDETEADLRGYRAKSDICPSVDYSSFKNEYPEEDDAPVNNSLEHAALDQSYCSISLKESSTSTLSDAYFSVQIDLHKKTDPGPEFTAMWSEYDQRYEDYEVEKVDGFGDEAYVITEDTTSGDDTSGSRSATLAVRDGWMTYEMRWSAYGSSYDDVTMPDVDDVVDWLKNDTNATLDNLRGADGI